MEGYLSENRRKKLLELGFDINSIYENERHIYYVKEVIKKNKRENILLDECIVISDKERKKLNFTKGKIYTHYYKTLTLGHLFEYLNDNLAGGLKMDCMDVDKQAICWHYQKIYYIDGDEEVEYIDPINNCYPEGLLASFIMFLLKNKKYLLE